MYPETSSDGSTDSRKHNTKIELKPSSTKILDPKSSKSLLKSFSTLLGDKRSQIDVKVEDDPSKKQSESTQNLKSTV